MRLHPTGHIFYGKIRTFYVISFKQAKSPSGKGHRVVLVTRFFNICVKKSVKFLYYYDLSEDVSENPILIFPCGINKDPCGASRGILIFPCRINKDPCGASKHPCGEK